MLVVLQWSLKKLNKDLALVDAFVIACWQDLLWKWSFCQDSCSCCRQRPLLYHRHFFQRTEQMYIHIKTEEKKEERTRATLLSPALLQAAIHQSRWKGHGYNKACCGAILQQTSDSALYLCSDKYSDSGLASGPSAELHLLAGAQRAPALAWPETKLELELELYNCKSMLFCNNMQIFQQCTGSRKAFYYVTHYTSMDDYG